MKEYVIDGCVIYEVEYPKAIAIGRAYRNTNEEIFIGNSIGGGDNEVTRIKEYAFNGTFGLYNRPCYGFRKDEYGMLVIDEEQAEIVRIIYNLYLGGATALGIKRELERRGIKSPTGKDRWNKSTIEKILVNRKSTKYSSKRRR